MMKTTPENKNGRAPAKSTTTTTTTAHDTARLVTDHKNLNGRSISAERLQVIRINTLTAILQANPGNSAAVQRTRLLAALQQLGSVTTDEARRYLDLMAPPARMMELRKAGHHVTTVMESLDTECGAHHIAGRYVLQSHTLQKVG